MLMERQLWCPKQPDLTVNRLDLWFGLSGAQLLHDLALEAGTTKHAFWTPTVERDFHGAVEAGADASKLARIPTTFGPLRLTLGERGDFQD